MSPSPSHSDRGFFVLYSDLYSAAAIKLLNYEICCIPTVWIRVFAVGDSESFISGFISFLLNLILSAHDIALFPNAKSEWGVCACLILTICQSQTEPQSTLTFWFWWKRHWLGLISQEPSHPHILNLKHLSLSSHSKVSIFCKHGTLDPSHISIYYQYMTSKHQQSGPSDEGITKTNIIHIHVALYQKSHICLKGIKALCRIMSPTVLRLSNQTRKTKRKNL